MQVVSETLGDLDARDKPTLVAFNKIDALEDRTLLRRLRRNHPDAAFISALRGIGIETLKDDLLALIEQDYVERLAYIPVSEPEAIARVHELADVVDEDYVYAENGASDVSLNGETESAQAVARMHFRAAPRNDARLRETLAPFSELRPVDEGTPVPGA